MEAASHPGTPPDMMADPAESVRLRLAPTPSPDEKGFFYPVGSNNFFAKLNRVVSRAANIAIGQPHLNSEAMPRGVVITDGIDSARLLVTEPNPESDVRASEATTTVFHPGLSEFGDLGSALRLHVAYAEHHPDERVVTEPTAGVSHGGKVLSPEELEDRCIEKMAGINLCLLSQITRDGPVRLAGTSLGSYLVTHMAERDLAANHKDRRLNLQGITLISSAVVALNVGESENFRDLNLDEEEHREHLTDLFFDHIPKDLARMALTHPREVLACAAIISAYVLAPQKALVRAKAIHSDFKGVRRGMDWDVLKRIASQVEIDVLGGEHDPLIIEQKPQWDMLGSLYQGKVRQRIVPGMGHLMTIDAQRTVNELDQLKLSAVV